MGSYNLIQISRELIRTDMSTTEETVKA